MASLIGLHKKIMFLFVQRAEKVEYVTELLYCENEIGKWKCAATLLLFYHHCQSPYNVSPLLKLFTSWMISSDLLLSTASALSINLVIRPHQHVVLNHHCLPTSWQSRTRKIWCIRVGGEMWRNEAPPTFPAFFSPSCAHWERVSWRRLEEPDRGTVGHILEEYSKWDLKWRKCKAEQRTRKRYKIEEWEIIQSWSVTNM